MNNHIEVYKDNDKKPTSIEFSELTKHKYFGYGRNVNPNVMRNRCKYAKYVGKGAMYDYKLSFKKYSTIEKYKGKEVEGVLYRMTKTDIKSMNIYEGYPRNYHIRTGTVKSFVKGVYSDVSVFWYEKNKSVPVTSPPAEYVRDILLGYITYGLNTSILYDALRRCENAMRVRQKSFTKEQVAITISSWDDVFEEDYDDGDQLPGG